MLGGMLRVAQWLRHELHPGTDRYTKEEDEFASPLS
jgi:hypothetical protein